MYCKENERRAQCLVNDNNIDTIYGGFGRNAFPIKKMAMGPLCSNIPNISSTHGITKTIHKSLVVSYDLLSI